MSTMKMQQTRTRLVKIYVAGIAVFSGMVGFVTVLSIFLAHLKLD